MSESDCSRDIEFCSLSKSRNPLIEFRYELRKVSKTLITEKDRDLNFLFSSVICETFMTSSSYLVSHESFCIWLIIRDMIRLPLFNVNVVLLLTISVIKHITEFLTVIGHYQQSATCEIEKVYYWRLRRPFESCAMEKQNGDKGVTHINRPMVVS